MQPLKINIEGTQDEVGVDKISLESFQRLIRINYGYFLLWRLKQILSFYNMTLVGNNSDLNRFIRRDRLHLSYCYCSDQNSAQLKIIIVISFIFFNFDQIFYKKVRYLEPCGY